MTNKKFYEEDKMVLRSINVPLTLWQRSRAKVNGLVSMSAIIRRLLELWLDDKIDLFEN